MTKKILMGNLGDTDGGKGGGDFVIDGRASQRSVRNRRVLASGSGISDGVSNNAEPANEVRRAEIGSSIISGTDEQASASHTRRHRHKAQ